MKKIILMLMMLMPMGATYATIMCAANDTVAVVLDPSIDITGYDKDGALGTWWAWGPYGTVHGISACINAGEGKTNGSTVARLTDTNNNETKLVVGGESHGKYCWCKMTHPAVSLWAFRGTYNLASVCASNCANLCGLGVRDDSSRRAGLFGSVAN